MCVNHRAVISQAEGVVVDNLALQAIARGADGGLRDAESTLDQLISFCGGRVEEADVLSMFGLGDSAFVGRRPPPADHVSRVIRCRGPSRPYGCYCRY